MLQIPGIIPSLPANTRSCGNRNRPLIFLRLTFPHRLPAVSSSFFGPENGSLNGSQIPILRPLEMNGYKSQKRINIEKGVRIKSHKRGSPEKTGKDERQGKPRFFKNKQRLLNPVYFKDKKYLPHEGGLLFLFERDAVVNGRTKYLGGKYRKNLFPVKGVQKRKNKHHRQKS